MEDIRHKGEVDKSPFHAAFGSEEDEFFSRVKDTEIHYYLPELKEKMLRTIGQHPPLHPDDWQPE